jgi:hypothetical protein
MEDLWRLKQISQLEQKMGTGLAGIKVDFDSAKYGHQLPFRIAQGLTSFFCR